MNLAMHCGTPMVNTFMFSGAEYYCVKCGITQGIFGAMETDSTPKLEQEYKKNTELFSTIAGDCIPVGMYVKSCKKCKNEEHRMHAGKEALDKSDSAYLALAFGLQKTKEETE